MEYNRPGVETFISKLVGMKAEDLDWASSLGKKYGEKEELDGRGDAARHLALGWLAANAESPSTAKKAIQAREYLDLDYIRELVNGEFAGKEMDLRNNELGMKINAPTKEEAERIISEMIGSGEATYMSPEQSYEMRGYAEGGEAEKEYEYGVGPEASGIGQFLSPLLPVRREVIEPYREEFIESVDPRQMERVVTPGKYGEPELAVPEAVQALLNYKGLRDPETRQAVMEGLASLPGLPEEISRRLQMSSQAAMSGQDEVYDPVSGGAVTASEALLMTPMLNAPGTAASIAMAGDKGGMVLGMMGGKNAAGPVGTAAREAENLFNEGRRDTAVYRQTGAIRATENKPAVPIEIFGQGGLDASKLEELLKAGTDIHASRLEERLMLKDYAPFPNVVEAYPELADAEIKFLDYEDSIWRQVKSPIIVNPPIRQGETSPIFYVKASMNVRNNTVRPKVFENVPVAMATAIQDYISQKEGFVRPLGTNPEEAPNKVAVASEEARKMYLRTVTEGGQFPSPAESYRAAQIGYPSDIDTATRSSLSKDRQTAMLSLDPLFSDQDRYRQRMAEAYGKQELDKYPTYFGDLMGDLASPKKTTIEYESPLFGIVQKLPQEKGTGNQFLAAIKKAGVNQEDLEYMGVESFLTNRKSVTKSDIMDRLYERETPIYESFLTDEKGKPDFFAGSYITGSGDGLVLAKEAKARNPRSLALVTRTDPISGTAATSESVGLHQGLPQNTFSHMRFNERTVRVNEEPINVLFIDEIQSDWHQRAGRAVRERMVKEDPDAQGKKSGNIVGGRALETLVNDLVAQQRPEVSRKIFDQTIKNLDIPPTTMRMFLTTGAPRRAETNTYGANGAPTARTLRAH